MTAFTATHSGILYIVATPIGNLEDISNRAIHTLEQVDGILAEDTRHSQALLNALGIKKPLKSLHAFNEAQKSQVIVDELLKGHSFALISDAGTPLISDPGYPLVTLARDKGVLVVPIPGACAFVTALSAAGVPTDRLTFFGFLPPKTGARCRALEDVVNYDHTLVFYESTHRILACLDDISQVFGEITSIVLAKELTKTHERFVSGTCSEVKDWLMKDNAHTKGEFVLIIPPRKVDAERQSHENTLTILLEEMPLKQAVKLASKLTGESKNKLYQLALTL